MHFIFFGRIEPELFSKPTPCKHWYCSYPHSKHDSGCNDETCKKEIVETPVNRLCYGCLSRSRSMASSKQLFLRCWASKVSFLVAIVVTYCNMGTSNKKYVYDPLVASTRTVLTWVFLTLHDVHGWLLRNMLKDQ
jgi:hypothetical protein